MERDRENVQATALDALLVGVVLALHAEASTGVQRLRVCGKNKTHTSLYCRTGAGVGSGARARDGAGEAAARPAHALADAAHARAASRPAYASFAICISFSPHNSVV